LPDANDGEALGTPEAFLLCSSGPDMLLVISGLDPEISPGHRDPVKRRAFPIGITGTRPVMTR
jgi:hypothetical protein